MKLFVKPRRAATVALIRNSIKETGIEVLLMKRHMNDRFLPGYHVFPGGGVDESDTPQKPVSDEHLNGMKFFSDEDKMNYFTHVICAIRETFEESGILLADAGDGYFSMNNPETHDRFDSYRKMIFKGELDMIELIKRENLVPSFKNIHYLTRWITPPYSPIRYDTRFFVALSPDEQNTCHDGDELVTAEWLNPVRALSMYKKGEMKLVTPTVSTLEFLSGFETAVEVIDHLVAEKVSSPARSF
jgi:8-oxo-dGTP pyrophosphatase MutT (NUDIX family)